MKKLFISFVSILLSSSLFTQAQLPFKDGKVAYEGIVKVEGIDKNILHDRLYEWMVKECLSTNDVIQLNDKDAGRIIGKGVFRIDHYMRRNPAISHTVSIYVKEGKFKYVINQITYKDNQGDSFNIENFPNDWVGKKKIYETIDNKINNYIIGMKSAVLKEENNENDDW